MNQKFGRKQTFARYVFAFLVVVTGLGLEYFNVGKEFLGFYSVGTWMIYVGFVMFAVITLQYFSNKKRVVDERMEKIGYKASRVTFLFIIFGAFIVMILDGIKKIEIEYSLFMANMMAWIVLVYFVSYKILEKYN